MKSTSIKELLTCSNIIYMEQNTLENEKVVSTQLEKPVEPPVTPPIPKTGIKTILMTLLVLIVIALGVVIFFLFKQTKTTSSTPTAQTQPTETVAAVPAADTADWLTYTDKVAGFSFKYPKSVLIDNGITNPDQLDLIISVEKLADIPDDLPMLMGKNEAIKEKGRLAKAEGDYIKKIGTLYGQISPSYSAFEVCSVFFSQKLTFYPGEYRVVLNLLGPDAKIMAAMPDFFVVDAKNCGTDLMWDQNNKTDFETTLSMQKGKGIAQEWYNNFYNIVDTIKLVTPTVAVSGKSYSNEKYGFELTYDTPYKVLVDKDNLYGYPNGVALIYKGGQAYDIVIEAWDTQAAYEKEYSTRMADIKVIKGGGKFITFLNNTTSAENKKIIESVTSLL